MDKKKIRKYFWYFIYILSFVFILYYIVKYSSYITQIFSLSFLPFVLIAVGLNILAFIAMASSWAYMVKRHHKASYISLLHIFFISQITRYVPGNIWSFIARFTNNKKIGVNNSATAYFLAIENLNLIVTAAVFSLFSIGLLRINSSVPLILAILLSFCFMIVFFFFPHLFKNVIDRFAAKFHVKADYTSLSKKDLIVVFILFIAYWTLFGSAFFIILQGFHRISSISLLSAIGMNAAAWIIGYLSFLTPSGLGVREGIFVLFLQKSLGAIPALTIAIISRVVFTFSEVLCLGFTYIANKVRNGKIVGWVKKRDKMFMLLLLLILIYIAYFSFLTIVRNHNLYSGRFDLGNMVQVIWNTSHGRFFQLTNSDTDHIVSRFAIHADIFLVLFAPIYKIFSTPNLLLILQSTALGLSAIPIYILAKKVILNRFISFVIAVSFLFYPPLEWVNFYEFHAVAFAVPLLLLTFLCVYSRSYRWAFLWALLAITTKEEIGLIIFLFGLYIIFKNKDVRQGVVFLLTGLISSIFFLFVVIPYFRPNDSGHFALSYYTDAAVSSAGGVAKDLLTHPWNIILRLFNPLSFYYLIQLLFPLGFLALLSPATFLLSSSELAVNLLSSDYFMKTIFLQYTSAIIPFVFIASIFGFKKTVDKYDGWYKKYLIRYLRISWQSVLLIWIISMTILGSAIFGALPVGYNNASYVLYAKEGTDVINRLEQLIPARYSVSATNSVGAHFSERKYIYTFPIKANSADVIVVLEHASFEIVDNGVIQRTVDFLEDGKNYIEVYHKDNLYVFEKKGLKLDLSPINHI